eukprot:33249-Eustigmatos_ZCMA.PRE.1
MSKGSVGPPPSSDKGIKSYYASKIDELELVIREKTQNLQRLKAQRNEWNAKGENDPQMTWI